MRQIDKAALLFDTPHARMAAFSLSQLNGSLKTFLVLGLGLSNFFLSYSATFETNRQSNGIVRFYTSVSTRLYGPLCRYYKGNLRGDKVSIASTANF